MKGGAEGVQLAALPVVLPMLVRLGRDGTASALPLLMPVLETVQGAALGAAIQYSQQLAQLMSRCVWGVGCEEVWRDGVAVQGAALGAVQQYSQ